MNQHLTDDEVTMAVAGLDLGDSAREHLASCVACRAEVAALERLIAQRRAAATADEPDWQAITTAVIAALPVAERPGAHRRPRWLRPALALAASVLIAVAVAVLRPDRPIEKPAGEPSVEEILAEVDELLADDRIPGFEAIDPGSEWMTNGGDNDNGAS
jgi:hypothetical protein